MALYSLKHSSIGRTTHAAGTGGAHISYISRSGACRKVIGQNMPLPKKGTRAIKTREWLDAQEVIDRKNARVIDKVMIALPIELTKKQRVKVVRAFMKELTDGAQVPWVAAVHDKARDADNPHAHIAIRDRDTTTGKRALNLSDAKSTERIRETWERVCNKALKRAGHDSRVDRRSLKAQGIDREPQKHIGPVAKGIDADGRHSWKLEALREEEAARDAKREAEEALAGQEEADRAAQATKEVRKAAETKARKKKASVASKATLEATEAQARHRAEQAAAWAAQKRINDAAALERTRENALEQQRRRDQITEENTSRRGRAINVLLGLDDPDGCWTINGLGFLAFMVVMRKAKSIRLRLEEVAQAHGTFAVDKQDPRSVRRALGYLSTDEQIDLLDSYMRDNSDGMGMSVYEKMCEPNPFIGKISLYQRIENGISYIKDRWGVNKAALFREAVEDTLARIPVDRAPLHTVAKPEPEPEPTPEPKPKPSPYDDYDGPKFG